MLQNGEMLATGIVVALIAAPLVVVFSVNGFSNVTLVPVAICAKLGCPVGIAGLDKLFHVMFATLTG